MSMQDIYKSKWSKEKGVKIKMIFFFFTVISINTDLLK